MFFKLLAGLLFIVWLTEILGSIVEKVDHMGEFPEWDGIHQKPDTSIRSEYE